jgi:hypothetical protein
MGTKKKSTEKKKIKKVSKTRNFPILHWKPSKVRRPKSHKKRRRPSYSVRDPATKTVEAKKQPDSRIS